MIRCAMEMSIYIFIHVFISFFNIVSVVLSAHLSHQAYLSGSQGELIHKVL